MVKTYQVRTVSLDLAIFSAVVVALSTFKRDSDETFLFTTAQIRPAGILVVVLVWLTAMAVDGAYNIRYLGTGVQEFRIVARASFRAFLMLCLLALVTNVHPPRINLFLGWLVSLVTVTLGRKFLQVRIHAERRAGKSMRNTLILGTTEYATQMSERLLDETDLGLKPVGQLPIDLPDSPLQVNAWIEQLDQSILTQDVKLLIIENSQVANADLLSKLSWHLNTREVEMLVAPTFLNQFGPRLEFVPHAELALVYLDEPRLTLGDRLVKRFVDILLATFAVVVLLPFMLVIAVGVFVSSPGPIFFIQDRVGLAGSRFRFVKFRTMVVGAQNMRQDILGKPDEDMPDRYKSDPRIYPFGRILRRLSLDELPQLFTVIRGKMSLVGPRPLLIEELDLLGDEDHRRHLTKPGLTGLWQINGRKETTWDQRIQLDLDYVHNWSIGLDVGIILRTIKVVLSGHGSY